MQGIRRGIWVDVSIEYQCVPINILLGGTLELPAIPNVLADDEHKKAEASPADLVKPLNSMTHSGVIPKLCPCSQSSANED